VTKTNNHGQGEFSPLYAAADNGHLEVVRELLDRGALIDNDDQVNRRSSISAL
jgi:ankyrin repeat protein